MAMIPFFLLWFGFSDVGKMALLALGLGLNIAVASAVVLDRQSEKDRILFMSFGLNKTDLILEYWLPRIVETLLPTLRFGLATVIGLVVVVEMLGAQTGLGYLIQTSRATFSLNVIMICAALFGVLTAVLNMALVRIWRATIKWQA